MSKKHTTSSGKVAKIQLDILSSRIEEVEDDFDITANVLIARKRASTGILALDMQWGGGMVPGSYILAGIERSGKSTVITNIFGEMIRNNVPINMLRDAEGTVGVDLEYTKALLGDNVDVSELLSGPSKSKVSLKNLVKPRIHVEANIEETFEFFRKIMDIMPDKIYSKADQSWVFKAPNTKEGQAQMSILGPDAPIEKRKKKGGGDYLYALTEDGVIGFIAIDSYVALIPTAVDEAGERSKRMSQEAASFAVSFPLIVEKLVKKGFVIIGSNQLRENPGDQYNPWREPGGNALKQYSQVRDWIAASSVGAVKTTPALWEKGEPGLSLLCKEESVEPLGKYNRKEGKGYDYYQFSSLTNKKNKTSTPLTRSEIRIWTRDRTGKGRGIDPVFDTWFYLTEMDFASVHSKRVTCEEFFGDKKPWFLDFKRIIIAEVFGDEKSLKEAWGIIKMKPRKIREWCFEDLRRRLNADPDVIVQDMLEAANEGAVSKKGKGYTSKKPLKPGKDNSADASYEAKPGKKKKKKTKSKK